MTAASPSAAANVRASRSSVRAASAEADRERPRQRLLRRAFGRGSEGLPALEHGRHRIVDPVPTKEQLRQSVEGRVAQSTVGDRLEPCRLLGADHRHDRVVGPPIGLEVWRRQRAEERGEHR